MDICPECERRWQEVPFATCRYRQENGIKHIQFHPFSKTPWVREDLNGEDDKVYVDLCRVHEKKTPEEIMSGMAKLYADPVWRDMRPVFVMQFNIAILGVAKYFD